jgi:hypothetical protein
LDLCRAKSDILFCRQESIRSRRRRRHRQLKSRLRKLRKARTEVLAISYAGELARWNIETTIIVPGAFTSGTNHFARAGSPEDKARLKEYESGPTASLAREIMKGFELTAAPDADVLDVAKAIVKIVDMPFGTRPFRVHIDPAHDGAEIVNGVADRVRAELLWSMQLVDLLRPSPTKIPAQKAS